MNITDLNIKFILHKISLPFSKFVMEEVNISQNTNYKNITFFSLSVSLLTLGLLNYRINQINTIIKIINPKQFFKFFTYIYQIKELNDDKLLLKRTAHHDYDYLFFIYNPIIILTLFLI